MAFKIRAVVPIDKRETLDAVHALTLRLGPSSQVKFGCFFSMKFGNSASLRERLAFARSGRPYRRVWLMENSEQIKEFFKDGSEFIAERVTDEDVTAIDSLSAFVLSAPANDFTVVAVDVSWKEGVEAVMDPYKAFQSVRSHLEQILWGPEPRELPQIPGFMLLREPSAPDGAEEIELPDMVQLGEARFGLHVDSGVPGVNRVIESIPQVSEIYRIKNYQNAALFMIPITFAHGQGIHTWALCKVGMPNTPESGLPGDELQPATVGWEFADQSAWQFLCLLQYWLSKSMLSLAQLRDEAFGAVRMHTYRQEGPEYRTLLAKQSEITQRLMTLGNMEDWVPYLAERARDFLSYSNRSDLRADHLQLPGEKPYAHDLPMQLPHEIEDSLRDLAEMTRSLQAHVAEYVSVATMKQQYALMEQSRRSNSVIVGLTVTVIILAVLQAFPSLPGQLEKWLQWTPQALTSKEPARRLGVSAGGTRRAPFK